MCCDILLSSSFHLLIGPLTCQARHPQLWLLFSPFPLILIKKCTICKRNKSRWSLAFLAATQVSKIWKSRHTCVITFSFLINGVRELLRRGKLVAAETAASASFSFFFRLLLLPLLRWGRVVLDRFGAGWVAGARFRVRRCFPDQMCEVGAQMLSK